MPNVFYYPLIFAVDSLISMTVFIMQPCVSRPNKALVGVLCIEYSHFPSEAGL